MIEVKNLVKKYGTKAVVNDISFTVNKGEIVGFLGPNGAGKSTTMNTITGYISSTSGTVLVDGCDILENPIEVKRKIGYLPEIPPLYSDMTVVSYLKFVYDLKKVKLDRENHINSILEMVGITDVKNRKIANLSKGYKQRVGLAQALIGNPDILILDEPTVGLDPKQIIEIRNVIRKIGENRTVILSSHILSEISAICNKVIIINDGKLIASDTIDNLAKAISCDTKLIIRVEGSEAEVLNCIRSIDGIIDVASNGVEGDGSVEVIAETESGEDLRGKITSALAMEGMPVLMIKSVELSLEEVFIKLTDDKEVSHTDTSSDGTTSEESNESEEQ